MIFRSGVLRLPAQTYTSGRLLFREMVPSAANHFHLYFHAAVSKVMRQAARRMGSLESLFQAFPFLLSYNNALADQGLDGTSWDDADRWWDELLDDWEARARCRLPLRALRQAAGLAHTGIIAVAGVGLAEEDAGFGALFESLSGRCRPNAAFRPNVSMMRYWCPSGTLDRLRDLGLLQVTEQDLPRSLALLQVPPALWDALRGEAISGCASHVAASQALPLDQLVLSTSTRRQVDTLLPLIEAGEIRTVVVRGPTRNGRKSLLRAIAAQTGRGVLELGTRPDETKWNQAGLLGILLNAVPLTALELAPGELAEFREPACVAGPLGFVLGKEGGLGGEVLNRSWTLRVEMPDSSARKRLWSLAADGERACLDLVAERYRTTSGSIMRLASLARASAAMGGRASMGASDVKQAYHLLNGQLFETLAQRVEPASEQWDQLALAAQTSEDLKLLESRCRLRERLATGAGFSGGAPRNAGVRALFCGPSGTGKTLAAQVLAARLQLELYRVDLSTVVNKYIGETEKNLNRIFARAEELDVVLLLDEGDALLTQRTAVQSSNDRYANLETNYLLQRLESFEGILIVTTNAADRIDGAFQRRMDVVVGFRPPETEERQAIWKLHLPTGHAVTPGWLAEVAHRCNLTGGQIRNAVLHAAVLALEEDSGMTAAHLEAAVTREYRKLGAVCPLRRMAVAAGQ